jgi:hypothetical protein
LEGLAQAAGVVSYLNHGAASCVYSEGCHGVTQEHLERFAELVRAQVTPCDAQTVIHPDGSRTTTCGSDQMRRACREGHAFDTAPTPCETTRWDMPRRKRETLQARHDYLRSIPHHRRNQYMEAEISALDWVLHRVGA